MTKVTVTGNQLKEARRIQDLRLKTLKALFAESVTKFEDEDKPPLEKLDQDIVDCEAKIVLIEEAQARYNLEVTAVVDGKPRTLTWLLKTVGPAGRREALWRATSVPKQDRYSYSRAENERDKTKEYARRQISTADAAAKAEKAAKYASAVRNALAAGNLKEHALEMDPKILE
jgi:hypothetical protein